MPNRRIASEVPEVVGPAQHFELEPGNVWVPDIVHHGDEPHWVFAGIGDRHALVIQHRGEPLTADFVEPVPRTIPDRHYAAYGPMSGYAASMIVDDRERAGVQRQTYSAADRALDQEYLGYPAAYAHVPEAVSDQGLAVSALANGVLAIARID